MNALRSHHRPRSGATLVEVLMSLMIIGLGVTSVFTLFPMTVLRSVKATTQTNAALAAHNAREVVLTGMHRTALGFVDPPSANYRGTYVLDPYGQVLVGGAFGQTGTTAVPRRSNFTLVSGTATAAVKLQAYDTFMAGQDSWVTLAEAVPNTIGTNTVTFPADVDLQNVGANSQLVIYNAARSASVRLPITGAAAQTVTVAATPGIPTSFQTDFSEARIETYERRYTWLFSVDGNGQGGYQTKCVVFFRRPFDVESETLYDVNTVDTTDVREIVVDMAGNDPLIKAGNFAFGTYETTIGANTFTWGVWYRILSVSKDTAADTATVLLDQGWHGPTATGTPTGNAQMMFVEGAVGVYDL
jgi:type II secretory pathway pseudopilin PulG